ncbi:hypothetical protein [Brevundimonas sp.]|uniref:hypothetical protein n=1 Tax=Brevundimonas sp. TaxID=1871086 RepID=UPI002D7E6EA1|nr:hypothetical protein [Brevundimonas sp.]
MLPELSPLGWFHTLGSLLALPIGLMLLFRHGRIDPSGGWGRLYLLFMFVGAVTGVLVIRDAPGVLISVLSLGSLAVGATVRFASFLGGHRRWIETVAMSTSFFTLILPSLTETLTRLPVGAPIAASPQAPLMVSIQLALLMGLVVGVTLQLLALRRVRPVAVA